jgi:hypothetical protein
MHKHTLEPAATAATTAALEQAIHILRKALGTS